MSHYKESINARWDETEGKKLENVHQTSDEEKWKELLELYGDSGYIIHSDFGIIDISENAMKSVLRGEKLTREEYFQALFNSRNEIRYSFEYCYYNHAWCEFKGQISRFDKRKWKVVFSRVYVSGHLMDGECYEGKEDHVWMDIAPFENYQVGDCISFGGEIYRYLKTNNGKKYHLVLRILAVLKKFRLMSYLVMMICLCKLLNK